MQPGNCGCLADDDNNDGYEDKIYYEVLFTGGHSCLHIWTDENAKQLDQIAVLDHIKI